MDPLPKKNFTSHAYLMSFNLISDNDSQNRVCSTMGHTPNLGITFNLKKKSTPIQSASDLFAESSNEWFEWDTRFFYFILFLFYFIFVFRSAFGWHWLILFRSQQNVKAQRNEGRHIFVFFSFFFISTSPTTSSLMLNYSISFFFLIRWIGDGLGPVGRRWKKKKKQTNQEKTR